MVFPIIPVPLIIRGRIIRKFRNAGAISQQNAKTLAELELDEFPFTGIGAKNIFGILQRRGIILNDGEKFYLTR